uniref:hypothetical protein n=1 Tax=Paractinoplanes polyasparticus TaxID=2856853 RepID=UPI001C84F32D
MQWIEEGLLLTAPDLAAPRAGAIGVRSVAGLLARDGIVLLVDGLDDLRESDRAGLVQSINEYGSDQPLVVTSRPGEFSAAVSEAGRGVSRATVIEVQPLRLRDAQRYLRDATSGEPDGRTPLFADARPGRPQISVLTNPLTLWLIRTVYDSEDRSPSELQDGFPTVASIQNRLSVRPSGPAEDSECSPGIGANGGTRTPPGYRRLSNPGAERLTTGRPVTGSMACANASCGDPFYSVVSR